MAERWVGNVALVAVSDERREGWVIGDPGDERAVMGTYHVEIIETVDTLMAGRIAVYRRWICGPDGEVIGRRALRLAQRRSVERFVRKYRMTEDLANG